MYQCEHGRSEDNCLFCTKPSGAWFIFGYDNGAYPIGLHTDELEARRLADRIGYPVEIIFWPDGVMWDDLKR